MHIISSGLTLPHSHHWTSLRVSPTGRQGIHFVETLHALAGRISCEDLPAEAEEFLVHDKLIASIPKSDVPTKYSAADYYAALYVKASIKGFLKRAEMARLIELQESGASAAGPLPKGLDSVSGFINVHPDGRPPSNDPAAPGLLVEEVEASGSAPRMVFGIAEVSPVSFGRSTLQSSGLC